MAKKAIAGLFIFLGGTLTLYVCFLYLSYIDDKITEGSGYGLKIGISKKETYEIILKEYGEIIKFYSVYERRYYDQQLEYKDKFPFILSGFNYDNLDPYPAWEFQFDEVYWDYLFVEFKDNKLVTIHRHRQYFEVP